MWPKPLNQMPFRLRGDDPAETLHRGRAMKSDSSEIAIPSDVLRKWQRIADLLANIVHVPSAVVCKLEPPHYTHYKILASSNSEGNPFPVDDTFSMNIGTFCETVIKSREPLLVVNALEDDQWKQAPEIQVGMVSYLGFPVVWPDGRMFGTICVLDDKANRYSDLYQELLLHCRDVLQADLQTLVRFGDELEDQKAHLSELFARVPEAVIMIDRDFRIRRVNPEFTNIFGYMAEEAIGHGIKELIAPDDLLEEAEGFLYRMFETAETFAVETVRRRKNGTRVPVSLICVPVPSHGGEQVGYVIYRDMTDTKRLEDEQRRYHEIQLELAHANRIATLGQLSASIAHELNQPLTGIITNCSTCLRMLTSDPQDLHGVREAVRRTMRDGDRASQVITRLRALFSNKKPAFEPVGLNEAAREVVALSLGEIQNSRVILRTEFADNLPCVAADRVQLQQVILNLLRNALDAMSAVDDRPRDLLISTAGEEDESVRLSVKDVGVGFDPHAMNKLFEAFYSTKNAGMGVGLAVSRSIIDSHHGRLWAVLNDGPGATFSFSVPSVRRQLS
ncbi:MAG: PAS domain S-box protein [Mesorhizobium sp.]|nr:MAG: PAS domain S-box protein [Mesorhizobium sp.]RWH49982.1 MAG: PAS domain S-box protein [Mesorhizobium sp.]RWH57578.1 MAG: PAS domain S-box protein [Mesorhizobium sp.]RWI76889.1 MAG: PAS domain S-box protein [Mesorhizobium sp.]RWJ44267.1 MAG: PAS domain S-box protein [Mesorhizobium sp.]